VRGAGFVRTAWEGHSRSDLTNYLLDVILDELPSPLVAPPRPFYLVGGTSPERDSRRPASGRGSVTPSGTLDAWAFYAWDAGRFVDSLPRLLRTWDGLLRHP
jgi:hypothetical protein